MMRRDTSGDAELLTQALVEPPQNLLLVILLGLALRGAGRRRGRVRAAGGWIAGLGFLGLVVLSLPASAQLLLRTLERDMALAAPEGAVPGAIVILSADDLRAVPGGIFAPPELGAMTLQRLRAGAALHRRTGLPMLVSGGVLRPGSPSIAATMARVLAEEFGTPARWVEDRSTTTWENAAFSVPLLRADGIGAAYVVTHGWHMRRGLMAFREAGLAATPAPTHLTGPERPDLPSFVPSAHAWADSRLALHEWIGLAWYALKARP